MNPSIYIQDLALTIPFILIFILSLIPVTIKVIRGKESGQAISFAVAIVTVLLVGVSVALRSTNELTFAFDGALAYDPIIKLTTIFLLIATLFTLLLSFNHPAIPRTQYSEHIFLLLSTVLGMMVLICSNDLILTFVGIELLSLPLYILIGIGGDSFLHKEASFKYFILGSFASAFLLFGISFIYGASQTTEISEVLARTQTLNHPLLMVGVSIFLIGLFFKAALVPFHAWFPDVYDGAPTPITAFMATTVKLVIYIYILGFIPVMQIIKDPTFLVALQWIAVLTMFFGNITAILQKSFKKMLIYSSVAHSGYIFLGIIAAFLGEDFAASEGILYYLLTYIFATLGSFGFICLFEKTSEEEMTLDSLRGLGKRSPLLAACISVLLFSLAGVPPFGGFFAKLFLFTSVVQAEQFWLVSWAMVSSVIGLFYYLRPVILIYMSKEDRPLIATESVSILTTVYVSVIMTILLGLMAQPFLDRILKAVA